NPAAVCPLPAWIPDDLMQNIAAENNLAETAFFVPEGAHFHLRWFTPAVEVDLCGHATLATAHVLFQHLDHPDPILHFQTRSGLLQVKREAEGYAMDFPADQLASLAPPPILRQALEGLHIKSCFRGRDDYLVEVATQAEVEALQPHFRILQSLDSRGVIVTAPGRQVDFVSRCFYSPAGIDEDPVTGSAHTSLTPFWAAQLGREELVGQQLSTRGGTVLCVLRGDRVILSGRAQTYLVGEIQGL
ncbi:MAG: PhzF family phenazine biosynthesis protein, partial [Bacteroidota bacterium]